MVMIHKLHTCCEQVTKPLIPTHVAISLEFMQAFRSNFHGMHAHMNTVSEPTPVNLFNSFEKLSNN